MQRALIKDEEQFVQSLKIFNNTSIVGSVGGQSGGISNAPAEGGNFLRREGDFMIGGFGLHPILVTVASDVIDARLISDAYTSRLIVNGEGGVDDDIEQILSEKQPGSILVIQGIAGQVLTIKNLAKGGGDEDIRTPGGVDFFVVGEQNVTLIYDAVNNEWAFMDGALVGVGDVPDGTAENDHLEWDNTGMVWIAQQFLEFGSGIFPTVGDLRFKNNSINLAFRNFADDGDVEIKLDTNDFLDITENNNGIVNFRLRSQHAVNPDNQLLFTVGSGAGGLITIQANLDLGIEIGASTIGIWKATGLSLNDNNLEDVTEIHGRDDATPFKIVFDQAEDADTFISDDTGTPDRINVTAGGSTFFSWVGGALPQVGLLTGITGLLTISDQQFNAAARVLPLDADVGNDEINLYFDTATNPGRWGFKRKTTGGVVDTAIFAYSPMDFDLVMGTSDVVAGGTTKGMTNIGELTFIDNLVQPGALGKIYFDGTDVFINSGTSAVNISDVIVSPLSADLDGGNFDITNIEDYFLVRSDGTPRMAIIGGSGASTQVLFDFVTDIDVRFTEALADVFELRMSDNTIRMHRNTNFETNAASNIGIASGTVATFGTVSGTNAVNMGSDDADAHSMFGYLAIRDKTAPGEPPAATEVRLFLDSVTGELSVFKFDGSGGNTVSLEGAGGSSFADDVFEVVDDVTATKKITFQLTNAVGTNIFDIFGTTDTYVFPDGGGNVIMSQGIQTIGGLKTFTANMSLNSGLRFNFDGGTSQTYITEDAADNMEFHVDTSDFFEFFAAEGDSNPIVRIESDGTFVWVPDGHQITPQSTFLEFGAAQTNDAFEWAVDVISTPERVMRLEDDLLRKEGANFQVIEIYNTNNASDGSSIGDIEFHMDNSAGVKVNYAAISATVHVASSVLADREGRLEFLVTHGAANSAIYAIEGGESNTTSRIGWYDKATNPAVQQTLAASPTAAQISTVLRNYGLTKL